MLKTSKLSQKIPLVILHRLVYNWSQKVVYLKIEIVEIGRFGAISGIFLDFLRLCPFEWRVGLNDSAQDMGGVLTIARGDGRGLPNSPRLWAGFRICLRGGRGLECAWGVGRCLTDTPEGFRIFNTRWRFSYFDIWINYEWITFFSIKYRIYYFSNLVYYYHVYLCIPNPKTDSLT